MGKKNLMETSCSSFFGEKKKSLQVKKIVMKNLNVGSALVGTINIAHIIGDIADVHSYRRT